MNSNSKRLDSDISSDNEEKFICSNEHYGSLNTHNGVGQYSTFNENEEDIRQRSLSMPFITCNPRTLVRSTSRYGNSNDRSNGLRRPRLVSVGDDKLMNYNRDVCNSNIEDSEKNSKTEDDSARVGCFCGFTKRQVKVGSTLFLLSFIDVMGFSIFAPFFPIVLSGLSIALCFLNSVTQDSRLKAESKNMSPIQIGLIFSAYSMAGIFASVLTGTLLVKIGPKFIIVSGMLWSAVSTILFGLLNMAPPEYFFALCMICRLFMGLGSSAAFTAIFAVIFHEFEERSLTMIGISESLCSIGGIIGPVLGGALYDIGGFSVPFFFLGGCQGVVLIIIMCVIPTVEVAQQAKTVSPALLLLHPYAAFATLFVVVSFTVNSFIVANLSQFLTHSFGISAFMVGVYMLVFSIFYGISTPIWGYIADSRGIGSHMMTISSLTAGIVMCFFGPCDIIKNWFGWSDLQQWLVYVCTAIMGVCMGSIIMPTFGEMLIAAKEMKLQSNLLAEYGLVSGLWNTAFAIGDILGPTLGGVMVVKFEFSNSLAILGVVLFVLALFKGLHLIMISCRNRKEESTGSIDSDSVDSEDREYLLNKGRPSVQA